MIDKIKLKDKTEQNIKVYKKQVYISLKVEKIGFHEYGDCLRVSGIVESGPEDVPAGSHHTFSVEPNNRITIHKSEWFNYVPFFEWLKQFIELPCLGLGSRARIAGSVFRISFSVYRFPSKTR